MKLLHTSDWHLGMTFKSGLTYREDQRFFIDKICEIAINEKVDGILLAGDVFDKSIASQDALLLYNEAMTYICGTLGIPVYIVAGNHDGAERIASCNELLKKSGLYIAGALSDKPQVVNLGNTDIYLLPWISTDKVKAIFPEKAEEITSMEDAYKVVLNQYRKSFVKGHKNILVAHAFITNAETSVSDHAAEVGHATMVGSYVFEGFDYVALGHIHGPQQITDNIRYSGTPMAYSFGKEEKQEKSVTIIDVDLMSQKVIVIPSLHKRTTLVGTFDELMEANFSRDILDGYVRLEVTDQFVGLDSLAKFHEKYKNLLEITGKSFDNENTKITMTVDDFEKAQSNPEIVFERYCEDMLTEKPTAHFKELFHKAFSMYEKEVTR